MDEVIFQTNVTFACIFFISGLKRNKQVTQMRFVTGYIIKILFFSIFNEGNNLFHVCFLKYSLLVFSEFHTCI